jgi:hypothetical protein
MLVVLSKVNGEWVVATLDLLPELRADIRDAIVAEGLP